MHQTVQPTLQFPPQAFQSQHQQKHILGSKQNSRSNQPQLRRFLNKARFFLFQVARAFFIGTARQKENAFFCKNHKIEHHRQRNQKHKIDCFVSYPIKLINHPMLDIIRSSWKKNYAKRSHYTDENRFNFYSCIIITNIRICCHKTEHDRKLQSA